MKHILRTTDGEIIIGRMVSDYDDPFVYLFDAYSVSNAIEEKLQHGLKIEKANKYNELKEKCPEYLMLRGYDCPEKIPEHIMITELVLEFSCKGEGLESASVVRYIVDDEKMCLVEVDYSVNVTLEEQDSDIRTLAVSYMGKLMFQRRLIKGYVV